jgi:hypothetical protein
MYLGLVMECDYREGRTQEEAFAEALSVADLAEVSGIEPNVGGGIPIEQVLASIRLYAAEVAPRLR